MADFTGFYFDNIHSSTYGLVRTSDGDRYKDGLIPEFEDYEIERVGGDGDLYEGRRYKKTSFTIPVAFDHMTEQQFRDLRKWLGGDELKEFRFDERPYKAYWAKVASRPSLEYVCFMELKDDAINRDDKERIYKGEGEIEFIAYDPFGYCNDNSWELTPNGRQETGGTNWQQINETYVPFTIVDLNVDEWGEVSGLKNDLENYNEFVREEGIDNYNYTASLYNPGDFDADFQLLISLGGDGDSTFSQEEITITITQEDKRTDFVFKLTGLKNSNRILLNTKNHSLIVYDEEDNKSLRYDLIKSTDWQKIPQGESTMKITCNLSSLNPIIKYNYKYY